MKHLFTECTYSYCTSHQNILLTCDFPTDCGRNSQKWRNINISDRNSRLNHISDKLTLGPLVNVFVNKAKDSRPMEHRNLKFDQ